MGYADLLHRYFIYAFETVISHASPYPPFGEVIEYEKNAMERKDKLWHSRENIGR